MSNKYMKIKEVQIDTIVMIYYFATSRMTKNGNIKIWQRYGDT